MAGQLFAIDIRTLHFETDTELVKNAPTLEKIADQVAAFERLSAKHQDIFWGIWTEPKYRRMGVASALHEKMNTVAVNLYDWEEDQYGDDILIKTMYCLSPKYREVFEAWLMANDYTDFCILKDESPDTPEICSATAEIHFFRTGE